MMSKKPKVYLAAAALIVTVSIPASLLSTRSAGASTTACGSSCTSPSVQSVGTGEVLTVSGSNVVMSAASTSNSAQDWTVEAIGTVDDAALYGVVSGKLQLQYGEGQLLEFQYAPDGVPSDQCLANTSSDVPPIGGTEDWFVPTLTVVLAKCGITAQSLWIVDPNNQVNGYADLINAGWESTYTYGAETSSDFDDLTSPFAEPAVLTVNSSGDVVLAPLSEIGGVVSPTQMWTAFTSADQSALRAKIEKSR
jgi:hypothetical protein